LRVPKTTVTPYDEGGGCDEGKTRSQIRGNTAFGYPSIN
jgi:hypothetical protein